ncbi:ChbG/HpnK family deacetylase [Elioraea tepidiphila]|uniref:ChbG/HpnK family deacetylase n=1 Tax=Elioraea tepidiphila TaxID=457934 RepID=UPI0038D1B110
MTGATILHADDVGMRHGANAAFLVLSRRGAIGGGSVIVSCPWFPEIARTAASASRRGLSVRLRASDDVAHISGGHAHRHAPVS